MLKWKIYCRFTIHCIDWIFKSQEKLPKTAHPPIVWVLGPLLLAKFMSSPRLICSNTRPLVLGSMKSKCKRRLSFQWAQDWACISTAPFEHLLLPYTSTFRKHICKIQRIFERVCCCCFARAGVRGEGAGLEPELKKLSCLDHNPKLSATWDMTASWLTAIQICEISSQREECR